MKIEKQVGRSPIQKVFSLLTPFLTAFMAMVIAALFTTVLAVVTSVTSQARETIGFGYVENLVSPALNVEVRDEFTGTVIPDPEVTTSGDALKIVSVRRAGYTEVIVAGLKKGKLTVYLKPVGATGSQALLTGVVQNYLPLLSGNVDGGLVLRTLGVSDLLSLNPDTLLSPLKDTIKVLGSREVPSNLVFPDQRIGGIFLLNKPIYRLPMSSYRKTRMVAIQAAIPTGSLMSLPSPPKATDLVNLLNARKIGFTEELSPTGTVTKNIPLTTNVDRRSILEVATPNFPSDIFGLNLIDLTSDRQSLIASDVKAVKEARRARGADAVNEISLGSLSVVPAGGTQKIVAAAIGEKGNLLSVSILPGSLPGGAGRVKAPTFLGPAILPKGALPKEYPVTGVERGIMILSLQEPSSPDGNFGKQVFVLPSMGTFSIPVQALALGMKVDRFTVSRLEFDEAFDSKKFEAGEVVKNLSRFTFSNTDIL